MVLHLDLPQGKDGQAVPREVFIFLVAHDTSYDAMLGQCDVVMIVMM